ncbi:hypothetical protein L6164_008463 [Bauhinia variegata]|uniref:Uncharacterized protein n=1 Tax=Bauhinia variegata TaxID=167791 RepID=A0ACB9PHZ3_BAUVA|nr:hypothetical protein L6164_008463 [Bauhinia variegata]
MSIYRWSSSTLKECIDDVFHSCSSSQTKRTYDVFFSFDGFLDTCCGFYYHLHCSLQSAGLVIYGDAKGLRQKLILGNHFSSLLLKGIEACRVCIIIFTSAFVSSRWCFDELEKIMECHRTIDQTVLPVFYNLELWEVGQQRGNFGKALE